MKKYFALVLSAFTLITHTTFAMQGTAQAFIGRWQEMNRALAQGRHMRNMLQATRATRSRQVLDYQDNLNNLRNAIGRARDNFMRWMTTFARRQSDNRFVSAVVNLNRDAFTDARDNADAIDQEIDALEALKDDLDNLMEDIALERAEIIGEQEREIFDLTGALRRMRRALDDERARHNLTQELLGETGLQLERHREALREFEALTQRLSEDLANRVRQAQEAAIAAQAAQQRVAELEEELRTGTATEAAVALERERAAQLEAQHVQAAAEIEALQATNRRLAELLATQEAELDQQQEELERLVAELGERTRTLEANQAELERLREAGADEDVLGPLRAENERLAAELEAQLRAAERAQAARDALAEQQREFEEEQRATEAQLREQLARARREAAEFEERAGQAEAGLEAVRRQAPGEALRTIARQLDVHATGRATRPLRNSLADTLAHLGERQTEMVAADNRAFVDNHIRILNVAATVPARRGVRKNWDNWRDEVIVPTLTQLLNVPGAQDILGNDVMGELIAWQQTPTKRQFNRSENLREYITALGGAEEGVEQ